MLYVGKANSIKKRVASHFSNPSTRGGVGLLDEIEKIDFIVTQTEAEALLAEQNFIRHHRPRFNVRLRDDKSYPYIAISLDEDFPRVYFTREKHRKNRAYFGPFSNAKRVRETLDLLGKIFQYRTCDGTEPGRASGSPCLDYFIKRCGAPCVGLRVARRSTASRSTRSSPSSPAATATSSATSQRADAGGRAPRRSSSRPRRYRNRLKSVQTAARAPADLERGGRHARRDRAWPSTARTRTRRSSRCATACSPTASRSTSRTPASARRARSPRSSCVQYYATSPAIPPQVIVPAVASTGRGADEALAERRGTHVEVRHAERGDKRRIFELARAQRAARARPGPAALRAPAAPSGSARSSSCASVLGMEQIPMRIECFDISNLGETHTVASMVVFEGGTPKKSDYRRFGDPRRGAGRLRGDERGAVAADGAVRRPARAVAARARLRRLVRVACPR